MRHLQLQNVKHLHFLDVFLVDVFFFVFVGCLFKKKIIIMYRILLFHQSFGNVLTCGLVRDSVIVLLNQSFYNKISSLRSVNSNKY